jgi:hypothetical protein
MLAQPSTEALVLVSSEHVGGRVSLVMAEGIE